MKYVEGSKRVFLETGVRFPFSIIWSVCLIKKCAAEVNLGLGLLDRERADSISRVTDEIMRGEHISQVTVDVFQTGSGTGLNMNLNELIAEIAESGGVKLHPNDHVNMSQSSNDVVSTAMRISAVYAARNTLIPSLSELAQSLRKISSKTAEVYKAGRTHLRDALPVTLGQEFGAFADALEHDRTMIEAALEYSSELPIGGSAVGTGLNTLPAFGELMVGKISRETGLVFRPARDKFRAMRLLTDLVAVSSGIYSAALDIERLCQDLRLMFSGPLTGLGEIDIPTQEEVAGSSIMPGKTNPVTVEAVMLAVAQIIGLDQANRAAATLGEFELSMGVPLIGVNLINQISILAEAANKLSKVVIENIQPDARRMKRYALSSPALITVISPRIGYEAAAKIGKELAKGKSIEEALAEMGYSKADLESLLDLSKLVRPGIPSKSGLQH